MTLYPNGRGKELKPLSVWVRIPRGLLLGKLNIGKGRLMSMAGFIPGTSNAQLQSTIAAATATGASDVYPHHPIVCSDKIYYEEDGTFRCEHASAPPDNVRTQQCVTHSLALLLIELAMKL